MPDYDHLLTLPLNPPLVTVAAKTGWKDARDKVASRGEQLSKQEADRIAKEGMAALRGLGDALLKPFGWSTNDFALQQQVSTLYEARG